MIESWTESLSDSHTGWTKAHLSITQGGPNQKFKWKPYLLQKQVQICQVMHSVTGTLSFNYWQVQNQNINTALTLPLVSKYRFFSYIRAHSSAVFLKLNRVVSFGYRQIDGLRHEVARGHRQIDSLCHEVVRGHREIEILRNEVVRLPSPEQLPYMLFVYLRNSVDVLMKME